MVVFTGVFDGRISPKRQMVIPSDLFVPGETWYGRVCDNRQYRLFPEKMFMEYADRIPETELSLYKMRTVDKNHRIIVPEGIFEPKQTVIISGKIDHIEITELNSWISWVKEMYGKGKFSLDDICYFEKELNITNLLSRVTPNVISFPPMVSRRAIEG